MHPTCCACGARLPALSSSPLCERCDPERRAGSPALRIVARPAADARTRSLPVATAPAPAEAAALTTRPSRRRGRWPAGIRIVISPRRRRSRSGPAARTSAGEPDRGPDHAAPQPSTAETPADTREPAAAPPADPPAPEPLPWDAAGHGDRSEPEPDDPAPAHGTPAGRRLDAGRRPEVARAADGPRAATVGDPEEGPFGHGDAWPEPADAAWTPAIPAPEPPRDQRETTAPDTAAASPRHESRPPSSAATTVPVATAEGATPPPPRVASPTEPEDPFQPDDGGALDAADNPLLALLEEPPGTPSTRVPPPAAASPRARRARRAARLRLRRRLGRTLTGLGAVAILLGLPPALAALAPPACGLLLVLAAWTLCRAHAPVARRPHVVDALAWCGFLLAAASTAAGLLVAVRGAAPWGPTLSLPGAPWAWTNAWLTPGGLTGLGAALAFGVVRRRSMGAGLPGAAGIALAVGTAGFLGATADVAMAAGMLLLGAGWAVDRGRDPTGATLAWAWAAAGATLVAGTTAAMLVRGPAPAAPVAGLYLLAAAAAGALLAHARAPAPSRPEARLATVAATAAVLATSLLLGGAARLAGLSLPVACGVAGAAPLGLSALRLRGRLAAGLVGLARVACGVAVAVTLLATLGAHGDGAAGPLALAGAIAAGALFVERRLGAGTWTGAIAAVLAVAALLVLAADLGAPSSWLPALAAAAACALPLVTRGARRHDAGERLLVPVLGLAGLASAASLLLAAGGGAAGPVTAGLALSALAPLGRWRDRAARAALAVLVLAVPLGILLASGAGAWASTWLGGAALATALIAQRWRPALLAAAVSAAAAVVWAPLAALAGHWQPAVLGLVGACLAAARDVRSARRDETHPTAALAPATSVLAGSLAVAIVAAASLPGALGPALLALAVVLQAGDRLTSDARLARAFETGAVAAWLSGVGTVVAELAQDPRRGGLFLGAATLSAVLLAALRRERWLAFTAGLTAAAATCCITATAGFHPLAHPALFAVPAATWIVAWAVHEVTEGRRAAGLLWLGLPLLVGAVLLQAHLPGGGVPLRALGATLGLAVLVAGTVARHRAPTIVGGLALALELLAFAGDAVAVGVRHPAWGLAFVGLLLASSAALAIRGVARAGGFVAWHMAWANDVARLREAWRTFA